MQNYQSAIKFVSGQLKHRFDQLLLAETPRPVIQPVIVERQMPAFQRDLFVQRSIDHHFLVQLQLMPTNRRGQLTNVTGYLSKFHHEELLLTTPADVVYIVQPTLIRFLKKQA